jgi:hypothetical protein
MEGWDTGELECWSNGVLLEDWDTGELECWSNGVMDKQSTPQKK